MIHPLSDMSAEILPELPIDFQALRAQQADLEDFLGTTRAREAELEQSLAAAVEARAAAEGAALSSAVAAEASRVQLEAVSAERRVLQETFANMRQECTERWVSSPLSLWGTLTQDGRGNLIRDRRTLGGFLILQLRFTSWTQMFHVGIHSGVGAGSCGEGVGLASADC